MISDNDRSGWFGASDTATIMRSWNTKTFENWWLEKLGIRKSELKSDAMYAGTYYEHQILSLVPGCTELDRQILLPTLKLRINLDGNSKDTIYECKTYKEGKVFKPTKAYKDQVQVQMFGSGMRRAFIVPYPMTEEEYKDFFLPVDKDKINFFPVGYDETFIENYLVRLKYLAYCLEKGIFPDESKV